MTKEINTRTYIIERTILIEFLISRTIGTILNIDWKKSKSFGHSSSSLSFNQKVQIIQDIKGLKKETIQKLNCLMSIRNKFAHVFEASNFKNFFEKLEAGKQVQSSLKKWYELKIEKFEDSEENYIEFFNLLFGDIFSSLMQITDEHMFDLGKADGYKETLKKYSDSLTEEVLKIEGGNLILAKVFQELKSKKK